MSFLPAVIAAAIAAVGYFTMALWILRSGHLHEDAYILLTYVQNLAQGHGIAYFPGGNPAEGATDFLWMATLALFQWVGVDGAIAAAVLNAIAIGIIAYVALKGLSGAKPEPTAVVFTACAIGLLLLSPIAAASLAGFSTAFFAAIVVITFAIFVDEKSRWQFAIPWLALFLGLVRPEGILIGGAYALLVLHDVWRSRNQGRYIVHLALTAIVGASYFFWRYEYFGYVLPLPLYVKSHGGGVHLGLHSGLIANYLWFLLNIVLVGIVAIATLRDKARRYRFFLGFSPLLLLLVSLSMAQQTQNVAYRFQGPITATLFVVALMYLGPWLTSVRRLILTALILLGVALPFKLQHSAVLNEMRRWDYINYFPYRLNALLDEHTTIALTEAGRMGYGIKGRKFDLVGLNTPDTAINQLDLSYLNHLVPDLIFVHTGYTLEPWPPTSNRFFNVTIDEIESRIRVEPD